MIPASGFAGWAADPAGPAGFAGAGMRRGGPVAALAGPVSDGRRRERRVAE